nr:sigma-E factor regulatory protein RseB domain-containing protein [Streptomonospora sp. PA3]
MKADELLLDQLAANYRLARAGTARMSGRSAAVLEAHRADGTVAGRVWVDERTGLPLRRETRDTAGRIVHAVELVELRVHPDPEPLKGYPDRARPWSDELSPAELERLRRQGWSIPERPAWNLRLIRAWAKDSASGRVVHLAYSDGLSVVSVFAQRGRLPGESEGTGARAAKVLRRDGAADAAGRQRMWDSEGFVYTAMGQAPRELLDAAAQGFPEAGPSRFWARVFRGFDHLSSAVTD